MNGYGHNDTQSNGALSGPPPRTQPAPANNAVQNGETGNELTSQLSMSINQRRQYEKDHHVHHMMNAVLAECIEEMPEDPMLFIADRMARRAGNRSEELTQQVARVSAKLGKSPSSYCAKEGGTKGSSARDLNSSSGETSNNAAVDGKSQTEGTSFRRTLQTVGTVVESQSIVLQDSWTETGGAVLQKSNDVESRCALPERAASQPPPGGSAGSPPAVRPASAGPGRGSKRMPQRPSSGSAARFTRPGSARAHISSGTPAMKQLAFDEVVSRKRIAMAEDSEYSELMCNLVCVTEATMRAGIVSEEMKKTILDRQAFVSAIDNVTPPTSRTRSRSESCSSAPGNANAEDLVEVTSLRVPSDFEIQDFAKPSPVAEKQPADALNNLSNTLEPVEDDDFSFEQQDTLLQKLIKAMRKGIPLEHRMLAPVLFCRLTGTSLTALQDVVLQHSSQSEYDTALSEMTRDYFTPFNSAPMTTTPANFVGVISDCIDVPEATEVLVSVLTSDVPARTVTLDEFAYAAATVATAMQTDFGNSMVLDWTSVVFHLRRSWGIMPVSQANVEESAKFLAFHLVDHLDSLTEDTMNNVHLVSHFCAYTPSHQRFSAVKQRLQSFVSNTGDGREAVAEVVRGEHGTKVMEALLGILVDHIPATYEALSHVATFFHALLDGCGAAGEWSMSTAATQSHVSPTADLTLPTGTLHTLLSDWQRLQTLPHAGCKLVGVVLSQDVTLGWSLPTKEDLEILGKKIMALVHNAINLLFYSPELFTTYVASVSFCDSTINTLVKCPNGLAVGLCTVVLEQYPTHRSDWVTFASYLVAAMCTIPTEPLDRFCAAQVDANNLEQRSNSVKKMSNYVLKQHSMTAASATASQVAANYHTTLVFEDPAFSEYPEAAARCIRTAFRLGCGWQCNLEGTLLGFRYSCLSELAPKMVSETSAASTEIERVLGQYLTYPDGSPVPSSDMQLLTTFVRLHRRGTRTEVVKKFFEQNELVLRPLLMENKIAVIASMITMSAEFSNQTALVYDLLTGYRMLSVTITTCLNPGETVTSMTPEQLLVLGELHRTTVQQRQDIHSAFVVALDAETELGNNFMLLFMIISELQEVHALRRYLSLLRVCCGWRVKSRSSIHARMAEFCKQMISVLYGPKGPAPYEVRAFFQVTTVLADFIGEFSGAVPLSVRMDFGAETCDKIPVFIDRWVDESMRATAGKRFSITTALEIADCLSRSLSASPMTVDHYIQDRMDKLALNVQDPSVVGSVKEAFIRGLNDVEDVPKREAVLREFFNKVESSLRCPLLASDIRVMMGSLQTLLAHGVDITSNFYTAIADSYFVNNLELYHQTCIVMELLLHAVDAFGEEPSSALTDLAVQCTLVGLFPMDFPAFFNALLFSITSSTQMPVFVVDAWRRVLTHFTRIMTKAIPQQTSAPDWKSTIEDEGFKKQLMVELPFLSKEDTKAVLKILVDQKLSEATPGELARFGILLPQYGALAKSLSWALPIPVNSLNAREKDLVWATVFQLTYLHETAQQQFLAPLAPSEVVGIKQWWAGADWQQLSLGFLSLFTPLRQNQVILLAHLAAGIKAMIEDLVEAGESVVSIRAVARNCAELLRSSCVLMSDFHIMMSCVYKSFVETCSSTHNECLKSAVLKTLHLFAYFLRDECSVDSNPYQEVLVSWEDMRYKSRLVGSAIQSCEFARLYGQPYVETLVTLIHQVMLSYGQPSGQRGAFGDLGVNLFVGGVLDDGVTAFHHLLSRALAKMPGWDQHLKSTWSTVLHHITTGLSKLFTPASPETVLVVQRLFDRHEVMSSFQTILLEMAKQCPEVMRDSTGKKLMNLCRLAVTQLTSRQEEFGLAMKVTALKQLLIGVRWRHYLIFMNIVFAVVRAVVPDVAPHVTKHIALVMHTATSPAADILLCRNVSIEHLSAVLRDVKMLLAYSSELSLSIGQLAGMTQGWGRLRVPLAKRIEAVMLQLGDESVPLVDKLGCCAKKLSVLLSALGLQRDAIVRYTEEALLESFRKSAGSASRSPFYITMNRRFVETVCELLHAATIIRPKKQSCQAMVERMEHLADTLPSDVVESLAVLYNTQHGKVPSILSALARGLAMVCLTERVPQSPALPYVPVLQSEFDVPSHIPVDLVLCLEAHDVFDSHYELHALVTGLRKIAEHRPKLTASDVAAFKGKVEIWKKQRSSLVTQVEDRLNPDTQVYCRGETIDIVVTTLVFDVFPRVGDVGSNFTPDNAPIEAARA